MNNRWEVWCPVIKDRCINGHNPLMGKDADDDKVKCGFWKKVVGKDSKTGEMVDQFGCISHWIPDLLIENTIQVLYGNASSDKIATEIAKKKFVSLPFVMGENNKPMLDIGKVEK